MYKSTESSVRGVCISDGSVYNQFRFWNVTERNRLDENLAKFFFNSGQFLLIFQIFDVLNFEKSV